MGTVQQVRPIAMNLSGIGAGLGVDSVDSRGGTGLLRVISAVNQSITLVSVIIMCHYTVIIISVYQEGLIILTQKGVEKTYI